MPFFYALEVIFMENNIKINSTKRLTLSALIVLIRKYKLNINLAAIPIIFVPGLGVATWLSYLLGIPYKAMAFSLCVGQVIPGILGVIIIKILSSKIKEI